MPEDLKENTVTAQETIAVLEKWKEKIVTNIHRGNVKPSRASSPFIGNTTSKGQISKRSLGIFNIRKAQSNLLNFPVFRAAVSTLTGVKIKDVGHYFLGNCHELSEIAMVTIMLGANEIKSPMKCEIISILDPNDSIVYELKSGKDSHVSVRITYPEDKSDENTIIVDLWTKDIYMLKDIDNDLKEGVSTRAKAARALYKQGKEKNNIQICASWSSIENKLMYRKLSSLALENSQSYLISLAGTYTDIDLDSNESVKSFITKNKINNAYVFVRNQKNALYYAYVQTSGNICSVSFKELNKIKDEDFSSIITELESKRTLEGELNGVNDIIISKTDFAVLELDNPQIKNVLTCISSLESFKGLKLFQDQQIELDCLLTESQKNGNKL